MPPSSKKKKQPAQGSQPPSSAPPEAGKKRKLDDADGFPPQPASAARSKRAAKALNYAEPGALGADGSDTAELKKMEGDVQSTTFWEKWSSPLLYAWLKEFKYKGMPDKPTHTQLVNALVEHRRFFAQPAPGVEEAELQKCAERILGGAPFWTPPPSFTPEYLALRKGGQPPSGEAAASPRAGSPSPRLFACPPPAQGPAKKQKVAEQQQLQQKAVAHELSDEEEEDEGDDEGHAAPLCTDKCIVCATPAHPGAIVPSSDPDVRWNCRACGFRGDKNGAEANRILLLARTGTSGAGLVSHATPSSGQSSGSEIVSPLRGLDRFFSDAVKKFPANPAFDVTESERGQALAERAMRAGRAAYEGTTYARPSEHLIRAIQQGKLVSPSFALPKTIYQAAKGSEEEYESVTFSAAGLQARGAISDASAPALTSFDFYRALVCTILPALNGMPRASEQWLTLARNISEIELKLGWPAAKAYLERTLHHHVAIGQEWIGYDMPVIIAIQATAQLGRQQQPQQQQQQQRGAVGPSEPRARSGTCRDFNNNGCTRGAALCKWKHSCERCGTAGHGSSACSQGPPRKGPQQSNRPFEQRSSGAASVRSSPGSVAAASVSVASHAQTEAGKTQ